MRKTQRFVVTAENRDKGKTFILTEMACDQAERWALKALLALTNTGAAIPEEALHAGMAGLAAVGIQALGMLQHEKVLPLLDELWPACVRFKPSDERLPEQEIIHGSNSQIEEVSTRLAIYKELLKLHTGFSLPEATPTSESQATGPEIQEGWLSSMSHALLRLFWRTNTPP